MLNAADHVAADMILFLQQPVKAMIRGRRPVCRKIGRCHGGDMTM